MGVEKMTQEDYTNAREDIRATYGKSSLTAAARRSQELARLYVRSGWTQTELAEHEHVAQSFMNYQIRFGRLMNWIITNCDSDPTLMTRIGFDTLSEGRFRVYWRQTTQGADEMTRFQEALTMLEHNADLPKAPTTKHRLAQQIKERFGDGKWHGLRAMATTLEATPAQVQQTLEGMRRIGRHQTYCERRKGGKSDGGWQYRLLLHNGHTIAYDVLAHELAPILDGLKEQGQKNQTSMVPHAVLQYALQIEKVLEKLAR